MRIIQVPFCYHPDPPGGTEIYVESLAHQLQRRGLEIVIAAPGDSNKGYDHNGVRVRRFQVSEQVVDPAEIYGEGDTQAALEFGRILDEEDPDIVHLHAFTSGVSLKLVRAAKSREIPVCFTYHTPTVTCLRGTLLRWGTEICAGKMERALCTACSLHGKGVNKLAAELLSFLPPPAGAWLGRRGLKGGFWTAARMSQFVHLRHQCARSLFKEVDHIVAVCQWVKELLIANGVPGTRITLSRQGLPNEGSPAVNQELQTDSDAERMAAADRRPQIDSGQSSEVSGRLADGPKNPPLRVVFLGRLDPTKGVEVLLRAVRRVSDANLTLDIYGIAQGADGERYAATLQRLSAGDRRITFHRPVTTARVHETLRDYDILAVPSQWLESGPLVVLEAFAAGVLVMGSRLGGIAELVEHEVNGLLIEAGNVESWSTALEKLCTDQQLLARLRQGIRFPRTMSTVADEMAEIYAGIPGRVSVPPV